MTFYGEMQAMATELLTELKQGQVLLRRYTKGVAPNAWTPAVDVPTDISLSAVAKRMHKRYVNGIMVEETGDMVTFAVPSIEPTLTDFLVFGGVERTITNITPIPATGTVVVYKAWCAA